MPHYIVRVTRDLDDETADVHLTAADWETAKAVAVATVMADPDRYYGEVPPPGYFVSGFNDDEECAEVDEAP